MTDVFFNLGRADALRLRAQASAMTGTEMIDHEYCVTNWDPQGDYSDSGRFPPGSPLAYDGQVWLLLQNHNMAHFSGTPYELRSLYGLAHTTKPEKAKPWVAPYGTSGLYTKGECYRYADGVVKRCLVEQTAYDANAMPGYWETIEL